MSPTWKPLHIDLRDSHIPPLLIKLEFGVSNYRVWLTDLTYIWIESLDRKQIIQRALNVETSIDPSEDASQLRLLLQSIQDALLQRTGTSVEFVRSHDAKQLVLHTSTPLPDPLEPLEWRMTLSSASQSALTSELIIPLLSQQSTAKAEKTSLMQQLTYKDNVISKLIDKMHSDGVDLSRVFPGSAPTRTGANARQLLAKTVRGLGEFDPHEWQFRMIRDNKTLEEIRDLITNAFDTVPVESFNESQISDSPSYGDWWRKLRHEGSQRAPVTFPVQTSDTEEYDVEKRDGQFQAKEKLPDSSASECHESNSSTTDDSDFGMQSSKPRIAWPTAYDTPNTFSANALQVAQKASRAREEVSGQALSPPSHRKVAGSRLNKSSKTLDIASISEGEKMKVNDQRLHSPKPVLNDKKSDNATKPKPRLGKIGGNDNAGKANMSPVMGSPVKAAQSYETNVKGQSDLNNRSERQSFRKSPEPVTRGRASAQARSPLTPRETSQERANRKRKELKRELESKVQTGSKKKRKF